MIQDKPSRAEALKAHAEYWSDYAAASNQGHPPMTEPTQAAKQRACDLANAIPVEDGFYWNAYQCDEFAPLAALAQLCQDISDALEASRPRPDRIQGYSFARLDPFILPKPAPDVLLEAVSASFNSIRGPTDETLTAAIRAALAQRGHEVAPIGGKG